MFKLKIYLGIAIIVVLGVLAMFHIYRNLGEVAGYLARLDNVGVPFSIAALEMEKNTGEYANGVLRYVGDPDPAIRTETDHDVSDFRERYDVYMRLSTNERERELGRKVNSGHKKLVAAGNALMDQRDQLDKLFAQTTDLLEQMDVLIDGPMTDGAPRYQPERGRSLSALQNIEAETAEVGFWLSLFKSRPTEQARKRLLEKVHEQHEAVMASRFVSLDRAARQLRERIMRLHAQVNTNVHTLLAGETYLKRHAAYLDQLAEYIDGIFDKQIQVMLMNDLSAPHENANQAIKHVQQTLRYIIPVYVLVAVGIGILLIVAILRPLRRLAAGTEVLGSGDLGHRIAERGNDEFGQLARQFNAMGRRLQDTTVSRELLEASDKQLRATVLDLREEINERRQAERERERLRGKLQRNETLATMGRLVAGVAHEVRNPLFGISSTLDAMEASAETGRVNPRYAEVLRREANRLNKLMAELLDYARTPPAERIVQPLRKTLAEAIRHCHANAEAAGVTVRDASDVDGMVEMNHDRLLQVHVNLIDNAIQHAPEGSTVIVATRRATDESGQEVIEYRVEDGGPGFAEEDIPHLFEPFFTRRRKGTGLGLAIARRIIDEHHGSIEPANRPEGGAVMSVRLPVA